MGIALETERKALPPVVKRTALAQKFFGAVVKIDTRDRQKKDDATGALVPLINPRNGKPRQELVVTCLSLPGTTASIGLGEDEFVPEQGTLCRLILKGKAFADWIQVKSELGRLVHVGDVVIQTTDTAQVYDQNGEPSGPPITDQAKLNAVPRGRSVGIYGTLELRAPKADSEWVAKAEAAYHSLQAPIPAEPGEAVPPPPEPADDGYVPDDEPPF
jgi:hypothetical protein